MDSFARTWVKAVLWAALGLLTMSLVGIFSRDHWPWVE
jgi:hypothetical protein